MTWYSPLLEREIYDRLTGDTGTGGLLNVANPLVRAVYNHEAPQSQSYPFIVFSLVSSVAQDSMQVRTHLVTLDVNVYVEKNTVDYDPFVRGGAIIERVCGEWPDKDPVYPEYGLDHWSAETVATDWTANMFRLTEVRPLHEDGVLHWVATFEAYLSRG